MQDGEGEQTRVGELKHKLSGYMDADAEASQGFPSVDKFVKECKTHASSSTKTTPSARRSVTRASGRACALSGGGTRAVGHVVHSKMLL